MPDIPAFPPLEAASEPCPIGGAHPAVDLLGTGDASEFGVPADLETLGLLVSSAMGEPVGCLPCQARHLDTVAADPITTGFFVEMAGQMLAAVGEVLGLPAGAMLGAGTVPPALAELWRLAGPTLTPMYDHLATLDDAQRRDISSHALDLVVGQATLAQSFG